MSKAVDMQINLLTFLISSLLGHKAKGQWIELIHAST